MKRLPPLPPCTPWRATLCLFASSLAACGGAVGQGNAPKLIVIGTAGTTPSETAGLGSLRIWECIPRALGATLYFQDGTHGDFTARAKWSSSNPGTVEVSNGDIAVPSGSGYYTAGTLVPVTSGSAIITVDYDGISAQMAVSVGTPQDLTLKLQQGANYLASPASFSLGAGTTASLQVTAWLDGAETDVGSAVTWSLLSANDSEATISSSTGVITAVGAGSTPLTPVASFPVCGRSTYDDTSSASSFTVQHIQSIALSPEFSGSPALIVGNSELLRVLASLDDGSTQDVSALATLSSSSTSVAGVDGYTVTALAAGGSVIDATLAAAGTTYAAPSVVLTAVTATLQTVSICWGAVGESFSACPADQGAASVIAGSLTPVQYHAVGTYDSGSVTQEITRQVSWASSDASIATISGAALKAGQALGVSGAAGHTVTISASDSAAENVGSAKQLLSVQ
jgi:hypothetical protein